ncbi:MAG: ATP-binding protein [Chloroflexales bacterium]|nr:ATP-binding protein [Chloroflexales bacterium]
MWNRLRAWFNDIPFHDPLGRRQAYLFQILLIGSLGMTILGLPISLSAPEPDQVKQIDAIAIISVLCSAFGALALTRSGHFSWAVMLALLGMQLALLVLIVAAGLRHSGPALFAMAIPLTMAGLILGRRALFLTAAANALIITSTAWLEQALPQLAGFFPEAEFSFTRLLSFFVLTLVALCLLIERFSTLLGSALAETQQTNQQLRDKLAERTRVEAALRESEAGFRLLFAKNPQPMWVYDQQTLAFLEVNTAAIAHYGYTHDEFLHMRITDIRPQEDVPRLLAQMAWPRPDLQFSGEWRHQLKDGRIIDVKITSHALELSGKRAALVVAQDITEHKRLQEQLLQSQKMESVGRLAGGIAHDFNNILTVIKSYAELGLDMRDADDPERTDLKEILKAADRAAKLTRQLLAFARKQPLSPQILSLNDLIGDMDRLLRRVIGEDIELITLLDPDLGSIRADPGQIEQVIVNLAVNARDAMPEGGKLVVETRNVTLDEDYIHQHIETECGEYVQIAISDTGIGMTEETMSRVFEPFFTTKEPGKGTGLGLAVSYGIVKQHGGSIWVYSEPNHGTTFKIYLPHSADLDGEAAQLGEVLTNLRGNETIIVVEDEATVRALVVQVLRDQGYTVLEAPNGAEGLRLAQEYADATIDLLIADVVMPQMSGKMLAERLTALRQGLKVLFISGYADNAIVHHGRLDPGVLLLQKPFSPTGLIRRVREVLDS